MEFKAPPAEGLSLAIPGGDWTVAAALALVALGMAVLLWRRLGRRSGPGGTHPAIGPCRWTRSAGRGAPWVCGTCGADARTADGARPRVCHRAARPRPL